MHKTEGLVSKVSSGNYQLAAKKRSHLSSLGTFRMVDVMNVATSVVCVLWFAAAGWFKKAQPRPRGLVARLGWGLFSGLRLQEGVKR